MSQARALASNMVAVVAGKAAAALAGLLSVSVLTRHLGPTGFGHYRTVLTYSACAAVLADCGLYLVTLRALSRPGAQRSAIIGQTLALRLVSTGAVLIIAALLAWATPYERVVKWGMLIGAVVYTCLQASDFLVAVFQSAWRQGRAAFAEVSGAIVTLCGVALLAWLGAGTLAMLGATALGALIALLLAWRLARRLVPFRLGKDRAVWRACLREGLPIAGSQVLGMAMLRGDSLLLSLMQPAAAVGLYGVPAKLFELASSVPYLFSGLMMRSLTQAAAGGADAVAPELRRVLDVVAMYGAGIVLVLAPWGREWLTVFAGDAFRDGAGALGFLALAAGLAGMSHALRFALVACGAAPAVLRADACACLVAFAAYFTLIPRLSFLGAALGTVIGEGAALAAMLASWRQRVAGWPVGVNVAKAVAAALGSATGGMLLASRGLAWPLALFASLLLYSVLLVASRAVPMAVARELLRAVPLQAPRGSS